MGENIGQTLIVRSGNADAGFIAHSQIPFVKNSGLVVVIPDDYHSPIAQDAVLLERGAYRSHIVLRVLIGGASAANHPCGRV